MKYCFAGGVIGPAYGITDRDIMYTCLPLYHSAGGMLGAGAVVNLGATMVIARKFSATRFWKDCTIHRVTAIQFVSHYS